MQNSPPTFQTIRSALPEDWPRIAALLVENNLPLAGADATQTRFWVVELEGELIGTAALETYGTAALLRSVAAAQAHRGKGVASRLVQHVVRTAQAEGLQTLALLTTTAEGYFPRFGFTRVERSQVPAQLQASPEFQGACPDSAVAMQLDLQ